MSHYGSPVARVGPLQGRWVTDTGDVHRVEGDEVICERTRVETTVQHTRTGPVIGGVHVQHTGPNRLQFDNNQVWSRIHSPVPERPGGRFDASGSDLGSSYGGSPARVLSARSDSVYSNTSPHGSPYRGYTGEGFVGTPRAARPAPAQFPSVQLGPERAGSLIGDERRNERHIAALDLDTHREALRTLDREAAYHSSPLRKVR